MTKIFSTFFSFLILLNVNAQLLSPSSFLGYSMGSKHTRHHKILEYFEHLALKAKDNVKIEPYGFTNEGRKLEIVVISSKENIKNLAQIKKNNLIKVGFEQGKVEGNTPVIVWLSHSIHGNESSGTESSMFTAYEIINTYLARDPDFLNNIVIIIDPCLNPDGREYFISHVERFQHKTPNPNRETKEHHENWPSGRYNHYIYDLNRDWAWQSQVESQKKAEIYHQWMPHIHADLHEQELNHPYYFAPAAEPLHERVSLWQRQFQNEIGQNHAKYFDQKNWLYFTKERFDLFYPSYGDTWPTFNGSIGMTYEQANTRGRQGIIENGDTLKFSDAVLHHFTTAISTIEIAKQNQQKIVTEFEKYFKESRENPKSVYKSFVIKNGVKNQKLIALLKKNKIQFGYSKANSSNQGYSYKSQKEEKFNITSNDLIINVYQPKSVLTEIFFDPNPKLVDSLTYDITAWALPFAFNLNAFACKSKISYSDTLSPISLTPTRIDYNKNIVAFAVNYHQNIHKFSLQLLSKNILIKVSTEPFESENISFSRGSILIYNEKQNFTKQNIEAIQTLAQAMNIELVPIYSFWVSKGKDLGWETYKNLSLPRVALLVGEKTIPTAVGDVWHYLEKELAIQPDLIDINYFWWQNIDQYSTIVLASGNYDFNEESIQKIRNFVERGGKLILMENALQSFKDKPGFSLKSFQNEEEKKKAESKQETEKVKNAIRCYGAEERNAISSDISGAIVKAKVDTTHSLGFGSSGIYFSLKQSPNGYPLMTEGWNVAFTESNPVVAGFVGSKIKSDLSNKLLFGVQNIGKGKVYYFVDNPLFRSFWEGGKSIFGNSILY